MKIIFFGTPYYVLPILEKLYKNYILVGVVTQPPRPVGRKQLLTYSPVDNWAYRHKIKIIRDLKEEELPEADLGVLASYGQIVPENILEHFKYGVLNIHPSLLPLLRGAAPIQTAIIEGLTETGVSVIKMDKELDHGPIISRFKEEIKEDDTSESLTKRLFERASDFIITLIPNYVNGKIKPHEQDHAKATHTKILRKVDGFIDLTKKKGRDAYNFIRGMYPWPGAWTRLKNGKRLKLIKAHLEDTKLVLDEVQMEGRKPTKLQQFVEAYGKDPSLPF